MTHIDLALGDYRMMEHSTLQEGGGPVEQGSTDTEHRAWAPPSLTAGHPLGRGWVRVREKGVGCYWDLMSAPSPLSICGHTRGFLCNACLSEDLSGYAGMPGLQSGQTGGVCVWVEGVLLE